MFPRSASRPVLPSSLMGPRQGARLASTHPTGLQRLLTLGSTQGIALRPSSSLSGFNYSCPLGLEKRGPSTLDYSRLEQILNH